TSPAGTPRGCLLCPTLSAHRITPSRSTRTNRHRREPSTMTPSAARPRRSLQTELLIKLALLLGLAVLLPVGLLSLPHRLLTIRDPVVLGIIVAADIILF